MTSTMRRVGLVLALALLAACAQEAASDARQIEEMADVDLLGNDELRDLAMLMAERLGS